MGNVLEESALLDFNLHDANLKRIIECLHSTALFHCSKIVARVSPLVAFFLASNSSSGPSIHPCLFTTTTIDGD